MGEKTLKEKTLSGLGWSAVDKLFQQLFVFISGILLARTLGNEVYGLIGILSIFTAMANILQESGFTAALIRKKDITPSDYTTVFYTNITIGFSLYLILFFLAPTISNYYGQPILKPLSRFVFLVFLLNSFAVVQNAKLLKEINYKQIAKINTVSTFLSYSVALILAYTGYGVWALASQLVSATLFRTILLWVLSKWKPSGKFSFEILKDLFAFSSKLALAAILNSFSTNITQNVIGKQYTLGITGLYNQATKLFNTATEFLNGTVQNVPYTVLSHIHEDNRLKHAFRKFIRAKVFLLYPILMGMILVANPFIIVLLGEKWSGSIPILQLLSIGGIFSSLDTSNNDILRIKGRSGTILCLDIFRCALIFLMIAIVIIVKADYLYMVGGLSICLLIKYIVNSYIANKTINYSLIEVVKDQFPYFTVSLLSVSLGYCLRFFIGNLLILMISQIIFVSLIYITILYFGGSTLVKDLVKVCKSKILKK